jgi:nitronate monooxygenase
MNLPTIIQGGMGVAVSDWRLAHTVSRLGQLGVVSGTLLPVVMTRRLQLGDTGGEVRRALAAFPDAALAARILAAYFIEGGKPAEAPFKAIPMPAVQPSRLWMELTVVANFVEIYLAKEGHGGVVGINLLEKIQFATLPSLYGAMLAGVDVVLVGAGVPRAIPGILDRYAAGGGAELAIDATGATAEQPVRMVFEPADYLAEPPKSLRRPAFLAIVSSAALATTLARKASGRVDGFVIEGEAAGGHNAPPRGSRVPGPDGQSVYGPRDEPELEKFRALGLPFWLAGARATPDRLAEARALGAAGVQIGTAFAFCAESGLAPEIKAQVCAMSREGKVSVFTDPKASPTGFPFKVLSLAGSLSDRAVLEARPRVCDLGYLRESIRREDGGVSYRCPGEPVEAYVNKGGVAEDACGRMCLCNGLLASVGLGQVRADGVEEPLITAGRDAAEVARFLRPGETSYSAERVIASILGTAVLN